MAGRRLPVMCVHNHRQPLDVRKKIEDEVNETFNRITSGVRLPVLQTIGLCMLNSESSTEWEGNICEDPIDAQRCPYFEAKFDKVKIWEEFREQISDPDWLRVNLPEVYGLIWCLEMERPELPWWSRIWHRFLKINVEPIRSVEDPAKLLLPPP